MCNNDIYRKNRNRFKAIHGGGGGGGGIETELPSSSASMLTITPQLDT